jgi:hypothetical protein
VCTSLSDAGDGRGACASASQANVELKKPPPALVGF